MHTALVTGANGFIGSALIRRLLADGVAVRAMCRDPHKGSALREAGADVVAGDIQLPAVLRQHMQGCDMVFHVAAVQGSPAYTYNVNVNGTHNVAELAAECGVSRLVHVSTIAIYGYNVVGIVREDQPSTITDRDDPYAQTKLLGERALWQIAARTGLPTVCVRPAMVYGPHSSFWTWQLYQVASRYPVPIFGDGGGHAHPIYIDDVVDLLVTAATHPDAVGHNFNCAPDPAPTWTTWLGMYARMTGNLRTVKIPIELVQAVGPWVDVLTQMRGATLNLRGFVHTLTSSHTYSMQRAADMLNWKPKVSLEDGMRSAEAWIRQRLAG